MAKLKSAVLFGSLTLGMALAFNVLAEVTDFSQAYADYQAAVEQDDPETTAKAAALAFELGQVKFGKDSLNTANLALNWASALNQLNGQDASLRQANHAKANELYLKALVSYETSYGEDAIELIDPLLGVAKTASEPKEARRHLLRAIEISETGEHKKLQAEVKMTAFDILSKTPLYTKAVQRYVVDAFDIYRELLPENAIDRVQATFTLGAIRFSQKKDEQAEKLLLEVVKQFDVLNYSHPYALTAHAYLVELYERHKKRDQATEHCVAIGSMRPWADAQEQVPIYRVPPEYPLSYVKRGKNGWVELEFTVNEQGFVTQPEVLASEGGELFEKETLKTLEQWRYAPKFAEGKPVAAKTRVRLDYMLN